MKVRLVTVLLVSIITALLGAAAAPEPEHGHSEMELPETGRLVSAPNRLSVVATTGFVGETVRKVAGYRVNLTVLMPPGTNPHAWTPAPRDVVALENAHLVFVNGLDLEENLLPVLDTLKNAVVVPVSAGIDVISAGGGAGHGHDDHEGETEEHEADREHEANEDHEHEAGDPHFWVSPVNVMQWVRNTVAVLSAADPANRDGYEKSAAAWIASLEDLDREVRDAVASVPREHRLLVTDHASFGYFARDYGFEVAGSVIPSFSDQAEPSAREAAELADMVKERNVRAIFVGETASRGILRLAESVSEQVGRSVPVVTLLTGSLALSGRPGDDYPGFIRYNTSRIVEALR